MPLDIPSIGDLERRIVFRLAGQAVPLTDMAPMSVTRMLIRAMAIEEFMALWRGLAESQRDWFVQTARGEALDRRLADFGVSRPGSVAASGYVTVAVSAPVVIPAGTVFSTEPADGSAPVRFAARFNASPESFDPGDGGWQVGTTRNVEVDALVTGQVGNVAAGAVTKVETPVQGLVSVSNPAPFVTGADPASDDEFREYWIGWLRALSGGTRGALVHHLTGWRDPVSGRRVHSVALEEWGGTSLLDASGRPAALRVYVDEGLVTAEPGAATASSALVAAVQAFVDGSDTQANPGIRAAGVPTVVEPASARLFDIVMELDIDARYDPAAVVSRVRTAITTFAARLPVAGLSLAGELVGQVPLARLARTATDVAGVLNADVTAPLGDIPVQVGWKAFARNILVTPRTVA